MSGNLEAVFGSYFDPQSVEPAEDFAVLPPGKYPCLIEKAEVKQTKKHDGHYIELQLSVIDGPGKGRKVWSRVNIDNPNPKAVEIGMRELSALGRAIGLTAIQDTTQLLNQAVVAHVKVKDDQNEVRTFSPIGGNQPPPQPQFSQQPPSTCPPNQYPPQQQQAYVPNSSCAPASQIAAQQQTAPPAQPTATTGKPPWAR